MKIRVIETRVVNTSKEMDIDLNNYPELSGMTNEEVSKYIEEHGYEMKPRNGYGYYDSLMNELNEQEISGEETISEESCIMIE